MKKILVIGGEGYIGKVLTNFLLEKNYKVTVLDNIIYGNQFNNLFIHKKNYKLINSNFSNLKILNYCSRDIDCVIILGGLVGDPITKKYPNLSKKINFDYTKKMINFFSKKELKLIFVSTCSNYGFVKSKKKITERHSLNPLSLYAKFKVDIEKYIISLKGKTKMSPTILRFATAFGFSQRMRYDLTVNEFTRDLFYKKKIEVYDSDTYRPYCHVKDFARLIELVIVSKKNKTHFQIFNAGSTKNNLSKRKLVNKILKYIPKSKVLFTKKSIDRRNYIVDFKKVKKVLGFKTKYDVDYGIKELINLFKSRKYKAYKRKQFFWGNYKVKNG